MDQDVYNKIDAGFAEDAVAYELVLFLLYLVLTSCVMVLQKTRDIGLLLLVLEFFCREANVQRNPSVNLLNNVVRRAPKRMLIPYDDDALDWHMRVNCDNCENERDVRRETLGNEMVERLTRRISRARKRRCIIDLRAGEEKTEQNASTESKKSEVLLYPPSGTPWIGFTAPTARRRLYIRLRSTEQTIGNHASDKLRSDTLKFGITQKVLNSGTDFEVPDVIPEGFENGSAFIHDGLWVEEYAPNTYADLISDETVNRLLLNWLRLWDECVFRRAVPDIVLKGTSNQQELILSNEKPRRPLHKVVLLAGPAGTGKTTLATIVAQHAGYRVVSLNASDERNTVDFEKCFEDTLRTTRTLDASSRPNCLILDEIDGASTQSIHYLCKAVTAVGRHSLRRPVICICNNLYTPSLRELRSVGLISELEHLKVESSALSEIIDACAQDLRSAINNLQFIASRNCAIIDRKAVLKFCEREKQFSDKPLFDSWASVFEISRHLDANGRIRDIASRVKQITLISELHGSESDRFYMGLFTNYLNSKNASVLMNASMAIRELCYYDRIVTSVNSMQDYNLLKYLSAACVSIHMLLCCRSRIHLSFPTEYRSAMQRCEQSVEIVESIRASAVPKNLSFSTIVLEILPYLIHIVQPDFKPMNTQLYSVRELNLLHSIVSIMRTYSLTFTSVSQDGSVSFAFKPAIDQLVTFVGGSARYNNQSSNTLSNAARQLIAHEIELQKLRNVDCLANGAVGNFPGNVQEKLIKPGKFGIGITFCYNSGSSSAIRRQITIKNLFAS
uniref:AAA domain-containing protein n=1 Tax=Elaeophora elaphi TaxID=1147741 RepID=A0A0R3S534_9BILA